jgi:hypothetical protein
MKMNMNIPAPKIGANQPGPLQINGDFLENSLDDLQLWCFWTMSIALFLFKSQRFRDWILSPTSG